MNIVQLWEESPNDYLQYFERILANQVSNPCSQVLFLIMQISIDMIEPIPKCPILDSFKLKEFADYNFKFDENDKVL